MATPAPEVIQGLLADLADDVPAGNLDGGNRRHVNLRPFGGQIPNESLREYFDLKGIHPDDEVFKLVNRGFDGLGEIIQRSFADTGHTFVSQNLCKKPVLPWIPDQISFYFDNFHCLTSLSHLLRLQMPAAARKMA